jgi:ketosteroid isomerase-like protein
MASTEDEIRDTYTEYLAAFHTLEAEAVAPFFDPPSLFVAEGSSVQLTNREEVVRFFRDLIERLKTRNYAHSEVSDLSVDRLSESLATARGLAIRFARDGRELERLGAAYTLRKTSEGWKFVTAVAYPPGG